MYAKSAEMCLGSFVSVPSFRLRGTFRCHDPIQTEARRRTASKARAPCCLRPACLRRTETGSHLSDSTASRASDQVKQPARMGRSAHRAGRSPVWRSLAERHIPRAKGNDQGTLGPMRAFSAQNLESISDLGGRGGAGSDRDFCRASRNTRHMISSASGSISPVSADSA